MSSLPVMRGPIFCGANLINPKTPGETCRRPAGDRTNHPRYGRCYRHGGTTPTQVRAAQIAMIQDAAVIYGVPRHVDPVVGLMEEYYRTLGLVEAYEAMVMQLSPSEIVWGVQSVEETEAGASDGGDDSLSPPERKVKSGAGLNLIVQQLDKERDRSVRIAEIILKVGLENRRVELAQSHVTALVSILLDPELDLSPEQRRVAARRFRVLDAEQADAIAA
jgi:hypothetical protein